MKFFKQAVVIGAGVWVGNILSEFVIKEGPDDTGFINEAPGWGLDDAVRLGIIAGSVITLQKIL